MSRGLGHVQRKALQVMGKTALLDARGVAAAIFGDGDRSAVTSSQYSSVRRALSRLVAGHHVFDVGAFYAGTRHRYCLREEAFWILHQIYRAGGGARALWPHGDAAIFYGLELRRRRRESVNMLRRLCIFRWRCEARSSQKEKSLRRVTRISIIKSQIICQE